MQTPRGLTLIETILYIALLSLFMLSALGVASALMQASASASQQAVVQEEGTFVVRKLNWLFSTLATSTIAAGYSTSLFGAEVDGTPVQIRLIDSALVIQEGSESAFVPLTTANVAVSQISFLYLPLASTSPAELEASTTINGSVFSASYVYP